MRLESMVGCLGIFVVVFAIRSMLSPGICSGDGVAVFVKEGHQVRLICANKE